ncbi:PLP-dependent cysteine synthase family protein [Methylorubrum extorquens]|uniref:L-cysteine desulfhydrase Cds1 n=1 Tax=Methylorubrum extorquens (strain CM4 / NCIMB 13688) TaxID=440085 RepID=B7KXY4_METC4|nr:PLP-dependent cysteine synthase family protein [Methylorubrum extorquens]ACK81147.1 Pyridoxal-5'-phosphate-dependent protein beta subunit [Methylorubrum extorquens CM4]
MSVPLHSAPEIGGARLSFDRSRLRDAVDSIAAEAARSADTHLLRVPLGGSAGIDLYVKDESAHPTGSLKHRLARSLFLYGLCNGRIGPRTTIVEASSGSTAVSEAYFAQMLGLPFVAVMPASTAPAKVAEIARYGGSCHFVEHPGAVYAEAIRIAEETGGLYMDQFTHAERATDWRGNNNIAQSIFEQMARERHPVPAWIVVGAGTGGTSATIGRYLRYRGHATRLCLADPDASVFHRHLADPSVTARSGTASVVEGIGRARLEPSFLPSLIDRWVAVPDAASLGAARALTEVIGRSCGASTGTNLWAAAELISEMAAQGRSGSVVTLLCDSGERYRGTHLDPDWIRARGLDVDSPRDAMMRFLTTGCAPCAEAGPAASAHPYRETGSSSATRSSER